MNLSVGIVGLPNVGKSTLFNALLKKQVAQAANYPFTTIDPNVGVVDVPDPRLEKLADLIARDPSPVAQDDKRAWVNGRPPIIPAVVKFVDIAGLVKGAAQGEGLGNQFLSHIREVDVILFVVRGFKNEDIVQTGEYPEEDLEVLKSELLLKDLETVEKRIDSLSRELKPAPANAPGHQVLAVFVKAKKLISEGKWLQESLDREELEKIGELSLLSTKKYLVVINSDEGDLGSEPTISGSIRISAKLEGELGELSSEEARDYLKAMGQEETGLNRLIKRAYEVLGLISFFTAGPKEVRAWTIKKGTQAPQAAGVIHTDFEKGFIAADVCGFDRLVEVGGWQNAKSKGLVKTIGKRDVIEDGMVVEFRFSV